MRKWLLIAASIVAVIFATELFIDNELYHRVVVLSSVCLILWLAEATPPFVPTLVLWALIPIFLGPLDGAFSLQNTFRWAADPVLILFFGGFALGVAAERHGLAERLIGFAVRRSRGSYPLLLGIVVLATAFLSMWLSNIAAAALMLACLRPLLSKVSENDGARRFLLVGVALGADLGGMATPIGTGPNAVAIASLAGRHEISFIGWMTFAFPLTLGMLAIVLLYLIWRTKGRNGESVFANNAESAELVRVAFTRHQSIFIFIATATILLWLSEPLHRIPSAVVAIMSASSLFLTGTLDRASLQRIDWSTLILIAGGITLGRMLEASSIVHAMAASVPFESLDPTLSLFVICLFTAFLASLMSNTGSVILMIPLASIFIPSPSTAILVAISASFGIPFIISTPPNAMVFGEGGVKSSDIFLPGLILMIVGCAVISISGPYVLRLAGIP